MANKRVHYAAQQVLIGPFATFSGFVEADVCHGAQSAGVRTDFRLEQVFELGQLAIYENIENIPNIEATIERVLDGYPLAWHQSTQEGDSYTLIARSNARCNVGIGIFPDTFDDASGTALTAMMLSGAYPSSLSYNIPVQGNATETLGLVCNNKLWFSTGGHRGTVSGLLTGYFDGAGAFPRPDTPPGLGGVNRREDVLFIYEGSPPVDNNGVSVWISGTVLPTQIAGVTPTGTYKGAIEEVSGVRNAHPQNFRVSSNFGRDELFELGRREPYHRYIRFPTEVTAEIEMLSVSGDIIEALENGIYADGNNLRDESIRIIMREGTRISLGQKCKLQTVNTSAGDTSGSNQLLTYTYTTFNDFTVLHTGDPNGATAINDGDDWPSGTY